MIGVSALTIAVIAVALGLPAVSRAQQVISSGGDAEKAERGATRGGRPSNRLTEDEWHRAKAEPDRDGARWKVRLKLVPDGGIRVGRPSRFCMDNHSVVTPFSNRLLLRNFEDGSFADNAAPLPGIVFQVVEAANGFGIACTLAPTQELQPGEILYLRDVTEGVKFTLRGHRAGAWRLLFSPDGGRLVSCGD